MSFIKRVEQSIVSNWMGDALTDYKGVTLQYNDLARRIEKHHILFRECGIEPGDRIAVCGRNSAAWAVAFLATVTYRAVVVPILHEFKPDNIHTIVNHSEARMLFAGDVVWENINEEAMPNLEGIVNISTFKPTVDRTGKLTATFERLNELFGKRFPCKFRSSSVCYEAESSPEDLVLINYTSGTTGHSKGVMLPYRSLTSNVDYCESLIRLNPGDHVVSMLPMGHVFGMTFDFLYGVCAGAHIFFLTRIPSPKVIMQAFPEIKPRVVSTVPLIVEKIVKKVVLPRVDNPLGKLLFQLPVISDLIKTRAREEAMNAFGGNIEQIIVGGAPFNSEIEAFLRKISFPYTIAYGMTECGPIISASRWDELKQGSCGRAAYNMEVCIDSPDPYNIPGELLCKGTNLMLGYYKNKEATDEAVDTNGWLHTGDMALCDEAGNITIKGRCKNMLLTSSGQNIYPEEIEAVLNNMPYVAESLIVLNGEKLVALVYPDFEDATANQITDQNIEKVMEQNLTELNSTLPRYSQITKVRIYPEEFEKTAKRSIKRFMYQ